MQTTWLSAALFGQPGPVRSLLMCSVPNSRTRNARTIAPTNRPWVPADGADREVAPARRRKAIDCKAEGRLARGSTKASHLVRSS